MTPDYIVQDSRYLILEELGCTNNVAETGLSILLIISPPLVVSVISVLFYGRKQLSYSLPVLC